MPEISAKWVVVVKGLQRAECLIPGCNWAGEVYGTYQEANAERVAHLEEHRNGPA